MFRKFFSLMLIITFAFTLTACGSKYHVEREGMPEALKTRLEEQIKKGEEMLSIAEDDSATMTALLEIAFGNEHLGYFDKAIPHYKEILKIDPNHFPALNNLGVMHEEVGEYETSAKYYGRLLEANPSNTQVFDDAIRALLAAGKHEDAQANLESFSRYNQDSADENLSKFISDQFEKIRNAKMQTENAN